MEWPADGFGVGSNTTKLATHTGVVVLIALQKDFQSPH